MEEKTEKICLPVDTAIPDDSEVNIKETEKTKQLQRPWRQGHEDVESEGKSFDRNNWSIRRRLIDIISWCIRLEEPSAETKNNLFLSTEVSLVFNTFPEHKDTFRPEKQKDVRQILSCLRLYNIIVRILSSFRGRYLWVHLLSQCSWTKDSTVVRHILVEDKWRIISDMVQVKQDFAGPSGRAV